MLDCREFVNADEIARGLSPFQYEKAAIEAGRLMLTRIKNLLEAGETFAFETTLATKSYINLIKDAHRKSYAVTLLFFWLNSPALAVSRINIRVKEGGHNIPEDVIQRRYQRGLANFFNLYMPLVDNWIFIDNSGNPYEVMAVSFSNEIQIFDINSWNQLKEKYYAKQ